MKKYSPSTIIFIIYLIAIVFLMLYKSVSLTPDRLLIVFLLGVIVLAKSKLKSFVKDWLPFVGLLLGYEILRGLADGFGFKVHSQILIQAEESLFGFLPTIKLQEIFYQPAIVHWYDVFFMLTYFTHFLYPFLIALYLWFNNREFFQKFTSALLLTSFSAFIFFTLFPTMPPWMAGQDKIILPIHKIINETLDKTRLNHSLSTFYQKLNPNPVAAFPSLHSGYVTLSLLTLLAYSPIIGLAFLPLPLAIWFGTVYMGEHYVVDLLGGALLAIICFIIVFKNEGIVRFLKTLMSRRQS